MNSNILQESQDYMTGKWQTIQIIIKILLSSEEWNRLDRVQWILIK